MLASTNSVFLAVSLLAVLMEDQIREVVKLGITDMQVCVHSTSDIQEELCQLIFGCHSKILSHFQRLKVQTDMQHETEMLSS